MVSPTVDSGNAPVYKVRGAPPRPVQDGRSRSPWRAPLLLVGAMIVWMLFMMSLAGFFGSATGIPQAPVALGQGVTVTPAPGWSSAENVWNVGPNAVSLQKAGALAAFAADTYSGSAQQLLDTQLASVQRQLGAFRSLSPASTTIDNGVPALKVLFSGTANSGLIEGELVAGTSGGVGVVMLAQAPSGQLVRVQPDLDDMLKSVSIP
jgi:hypothetical protein